MSKFERVKAGLEANVRLRGEVAKEEKQRWKDVFAKIPADRHRMATILLGDPRANSMTSAEIIAACNIGRPSSPEGPVNDRQALFVQGMQDAARLLGKPAPSVSEAYPAPPREFHLDPALFAAGERDAKALKSFMANAQ